MSGHLLTNSSWSTASISGFGKYFDLTKGHYADGFVTCTLHTSIFNIESGDALNPPATENIEIYQTVIENDFVYINIT